MFLLTIFTFPVAAVKFQKADVYDYESEEKFLAISAIILALYCSILVV